MTFQRACTYNRHRKSYGKNTKKVFPGGFVQTNDAVFQELEEVGNHLRMNKYFCVYDIETALELVDRNECQPPAALPSPTY